jgi:hypothetical protein
MGPESTCPVPKWKQNQENEHDAQKNQKNLVFSVDSGMGQ